LFVGENTGLWKREFRKYVATVGQQTQTKGRGGSKKVPLQLQACPESNHHLVVSPCHGHSRLELHALETSEAPRTVSVPGIPHNSELTPPPGPPDSRSHDNLHDPAGRDNIRIALHHTPQLPVVQAGKDVCVDVFHRRAAELVPNNVCRVREVLQAGYDIVILLDRLRHRSKPPLE